MADYAFVVWSGTRQKSVVKRSDITKGVTAPNQIVSVRWKGKSYAATIIRLGKRFAISNYVICCCTGDDKQELTQEMLKLTTIQASHNQKKT